MKNLFLNPNDVTLKDKTMTFIFGFHITSLFAGIPALFVIILADINGWDFVLYCIAAWGLLWAFLWLLAIILNVLE